MLFQSIDNVIVLIEELFKPIFDDNFKSISLDDSILDDGSLIFTLLAFSLAFNDNDEEDIEDEEEEWGDAIG